MPRGAAQSGRPVEPGSIRSSSCAAPSGQAGMPAPPQSLVGRAFLPARSGSISTHLEEPIDPTVPHSSTAGETHRVRGKYRLRKAGRWEGVGSWRNGPQGAAAPRSIDPPLAVMELYLRGEANALSECFLVSSGTSATRATSRSTRSCGRYIDEFVKRFLTLFTEPDYVPSRGHLAEFVRLNPTISNIVALLGLRDDRRVPRAARRRPGQARQAAGICSARNTVPVNRASFFNLDPALGERLVPRLRLDLPARPARPGRLGQPPGPLRVRRPPARPDALADAQLLRLHLCGERRRPARPLGDQRVGPGGRRGPPGGPEPPQPPEGRGRERELG